MPDASQNPFQNPDGTFLPPLAGNPIDPNTGLPYPGPMGAAPPMPTHLSAPSGQVPSQPFPPMSVAMANTMPTMPGIGSTSGAPAPVQKPDIVNDPVMQREREAGQAYANAAAKNPSWWRTILALAPQVLLQKHPQAGQAIAQALLSRDPNIQNANRLQAQYGIARQEAEDYLKQRQLEENVGLRQAIYGTRTENSKNAEIDRELRRYDALTDKSGAIPPLPSAAPMPAPQIPGSPPTVTPPSISQYATQGPLAQPTVTGGQAPPLSPAMQSAMAANAPAPPGSTLQGYHRTSALDPNTMHQVPLDVPEPDVLAAQKANAQRRAQLQATSDARRMELAQRGIPTPQIISDALPGIGPMVLPEDLPHLAATVNSLAKQQGGDDKWEIKTETDDKGNVRVFRVNKTTGEIEAPKQVGQIGKSKTDPMATLANAGVTDEDWKGAAQQYALTGEMPALGRDSVSRGKIIHYSQQWMRDNGLTPRDMAVLKSAYKGDTASMAKLQGNRDAIVSFENTALANSDQFLQNAQKIIDTGSPVINQPLRTADEKLVGNANMPAFQAARTVALNEYAKILTSAGLTNAPLSDEARKEVGAFLNPNMTLQQYVNVIKVLKRDADNRKNSMDAMLNEIRARVGNSVPFRPSAGGGTPTPTNPSAPANPYR